MEETGKSCNERINGNTAVLSCGIFELPHICAYN